MSIFANTTYTTDGVLSGNQTNATSETNEDATSVAPGNDASKDITLAVEILDIITAGMTIIGLLGESNVNKLN